MVDFNLMGQNQHPSKLKKRNSLVYGVLISSLSFTYPMITVLFFFSFFFMTVIYLMVMAMIYIVDNES